jgi:hypothetical protein
MSEKGAPVAAGAPRVAHAGPKEVIAMRVFISHAAADEDLARQVADALKVSGFLVWDISDVLPGDNWGEKLAEALKESEAMIVLLTPSAVRAANVTSEVGYALGQKQYKDRLIPVIAAPPELLPREEIPWVLARMKTITLTGADREEGLRKIAEALRGAA